MNITKHKLFTIFYSIISIYIIIYLTNLTLPIVSKYLFLLLNILKPFLIAFFIAFLLHTTVDRLEKRGLNRALAVLFVFLIFFILLAYLFSILIPIIIHQIQDLVDNIPVMYVQLHDFIDNFWNQFSFLPQKYKFDIHDAEQFAEHELFDFKFSKSRFNSLLDSFNVLILTPIITFYFLYEYNNIVQGVKRFINRHRLRYLDKFLHKLDYGLGSYFRGLILILNLMTVLSTVLFMIFGLKYPLLFGIIIGYTNVIPIIGPYIGGIPAVLFALTQSFNTAIIVTVIIVGIQIIESNIVTPYIQSRSIDVHPLLILLAFVVFGKFFGIVGMILSIPLLYIIVLIIHYILVYNRVKRYKKATGKQVEANP